MDKQFWKTIQDNDCNIPEGYTVKSLTPELLSLLGSTDPELRDNLAYEILVEWVERDLYAPDELRQIITDLSTNLKTKINEGQTDSIFLRSFSILALALMVYYNNKKSFLKPEEIEIILDNGLRYLATEKDPRGYIPVKGWAHALAHTADLLLVLSKNEHTNANQHLRIMNGISNKLAHSTDWVYVHGEDDRLSGAMLHIFRRGLVASDDVKEWLASFTGDWKGGWTDEERTHAFFNVRNFIRSLYLQVATEEELPNQKELEAMLLNVIQTMRAY